MGTSVNFHHRRNVRRLCLFYELYKNDFPKYLSRNIETCKPKNSLRLLHKQLLTNWPCRTKKFSLTFFPSVIKYWNALDQRTKQCEKLHSFKNVLLKKIRPKRKEYFGILDKDGSRCITLLRMSLSPLKKHKFDHNFTDTPDIICPFGDGIDDTEHFLLLCKSFRDIRATLMQNVSNIMNVNFDLFPNKRKIEYLLYGSDTLKYE